MHPIVSAFAGLFLLFTGPANADVRRVDLPPVFDISDEEMTMPLGVVNGMVLRNDVLQILDDHNCNVRRIHVSGRVLDPIGRQGEGPGDMLFPERLAVATDGRCVIVQTFSKTAACITADGKGCDKISMSAIRDGFATVFVSRAELDPGGRLLLSAVTMREHVESFDLETVKRNMGATLWRLDEAGRAEVIATTQPQWSGPGLIECSSSWNSIRAWDINAAGDLAFSDPTGAYRLLIVPAGERVPRQVDLVQQPGDEEALARITRRFREKGPVDPARVGGVMWLDERRLLVTPTAAFELPVPRGRQGIHDVFDASGQHQGRYDLNC
jgi:hypothetical protein